MNSLFHFKPITPILACVVFCGLLITGCSSLREAEKKMWGSSTLALEKARGKGKVESFSYSLPDCFNASREVLKKEGVTVFSVNKAKGLIIAMGFPDVIDTTQVGIFFEKSENGLTKIEITSLNPRLLEALAPVIFSDINKQLKGGSIDKLKGVTKE